jgi:ketosteroid isomerase-like protein
MESSNVIAARRYLRAVESLGPAEDVAAFYAPDVVFREFPNRISPKGRVAGIAEMGEAWKRGRQLLRSQTYNVQRIVEAGDELAVELEWTGVLATPVMTLPAGAEMKAFVAMFLTFRDGKIVSQRNYDCYPPLGE